MCVGVVPEEISIKVEKAIDIKDEIPEAVSSPSIKTEHEVRLWGCLRCWQLMLLRPFIAINKKF
jgi:hypothetical protein